jgi:pimeloyl-ACP methyl ester carboxylesterase
MDFWDLALINALAARRPVIIFDSAGVGKSSGKIPPTYQGWADSVITFIEALGIKRIDLLGFSMGGCCVQMVALTALWLVRKLILAGTRASQGPTMDTNSMHPGPFAFLSSSNTSEDIEKSIAESFYYWTGEGRAAAKAS